MHSLGRRAGAVRVEAVDQLSGRVRMVVGRRRSEWDGGNACPAFQLGPPRLICGGGLRQASTIDTRFASRRVSGHKGRAVGLVLARVHGRQGPKQKDRIDRLQGVARIINTAMPHATNVTVKPFPREGGIDLGAEILGADLNNLDGGFEGHASDTLTGTRLTVRQMPLSKSSAMRSTTTPSSCSRVNKDSRQRPSTSSHSASTPCRRATDMASRMVPKSPSCIRTSRRSLINLKVCTDLLARARSRRLTRLQCR